ncbi:MAG: multiheme c-type cytochrome [Pirellulaceae bacterium]|nr:multiheme c-type cytochrome [Pirellulaceae bacterium]
MIRSVWSLAISITSLLLVQGATRESRAQAPPTFHATSTDNCIGCHFRDPIPGQRDSFAGSKDFCRRQQGSLWSHEDKHRQSLLLLLRPAKNLELTERILGFPIADVLDFEPAELTAVPDLERLKKPISFRPGAKQEQITKVQQCLSCHAPLAEPIDANPLQKLTTLEFGVSCQVCHGLGREYELAHARSTWRLVKASAKEQKYGMTDLRDPVERANLCVSCHVGSVTTTPPRFVRHEWYANGHPPLPSFEFSSFSTQEPPHWRPIQEKLAQPAGFNYARGSLTMDDRAAIAGSDFRGVLQADDLAENYFAANPGSYSTSPEQDWGRTKDVAISSLAVLRGYAALIADWPANEPLDFSHFDCGSCHHELRSEFPSSFRVRRTGVVGRPPAALWTTALPRLAAGSVGPANPPELAKFDTAIMQLNQGYSARPFGDRTIVTEAAQELKATCDLLGASLARMPTDAAAGKALLAKLLNPANDDHRDYHAARQIAWATCEILKDAAGVPERNFALAEPEENDKPEPAPKLTPEILKLLRGPGNAQIAADNKFVRERIERIFNEPIYGTESNPLHLKLPAGQTETVTGHLAESLAAIAAFDPQLFNKRLKEIREALGIEPAKP